MPVAILLLHSRWVKHLIHDRKNFYSVPGAYDPERTQSHFDHLAHHVHFLYVPFLLRPETPEVDKVPEKSWTKLKIQYSGWWEGIVLSDIRPVFSYHTLSKLANVSRNWMLIYAPKQYLIIAHRPYFITLLDSLFGSIVQVEVKGFLGIETRCVSIFCHVSCSHKTNTSSTY